MAPPLLAPHGFGDPEDPQERYFAMLCRDARMQNEKIHRKREMIRKDLRKLMDKALDCEASYWKGYHQRLGEIIQRHPKIGESGWANMFGHNEWHFLDHVQTQQAKLHQDALRKQDELMAANLEFWTAWRKHVDFMRGLPASSGSKSAATVPDAAPQPNDDATVSEPNTGDGTQWYSKTAHAAREEQDDSGPLLARPILAIITDKPPPGAAQAQSSAQTTKDPKGKGKAKEVAPSTSPFAVPTPLSLAPSPGPSMSAPVAVSEPQSGLFSRPGSHALTGQSGSSQEPESSAHAAKRRRSSTKAAASKHSKTITAINVAQPSPKTLSKQPAAPANEGDGFHGVADPVVGEIYQAYYKDATQQGWWMCTPLPWDAWERRIGINFSFDKLSLWSDLPGDQYQVDRVRAKAKGRRTRKVITGWKGEYRTGGSKMEERIFPVLLFDDVEGEPANFQFPADHNKAFTFSKKALGALPTEWIAAKDLRIVGTDVGGPVGGRETAQRFRERLEARNVLREKNMLATPRKSRASGSLGPSVASSPMEGSSVMAASSLMEDNSAPLEASSLDEDAPGESVSRDDTEMADAESLSGATAVEGETAGQPDVLEMSYPLVIKAAEAAPAKSSPTTNTPPTAQPAQGSLDKGWRSVVFG